MCNFSEIKNNNKENKNVYAVAIKSYYINRYDFTSRKQQRAFCVSGLVLVDSTENPDLCVYCDTAWPHICLPCLRSSGTYT